MNSDLLSVLIPLYNEEEFIGELLARVVGAPLPDGLTRRSARPLRKPYRFTMNASESSPK
jgi:hypothetical protein